MAEKTSSKKRRKYDTDFKAEVLKLVASGKPVTEIAQSLGVGENIIYRWKSKQRQMLSGQLKVGQLTDVWQEVDQLREKLRQTELERDILDQQTMSASGPYSRVIVGWQIDDNMEEELIINALQKGLQWRKPVPGLIVHSERGGQYVGNQFRKLLNKHHCEQSMSRADDPYDNAFAISYYVDRIDQSFFYRFKAETLQEGVFFELGRCPNRNL